MATSTNKSNAATKEPLTSTTVIGGETGTAGSDDIYNVQEKNMSKNVILRKFYHFNDKIPARLVLYFLSWTGFMVSFMMRNDINIALVAMTATNNADNSTTIINHNNNSNLMLNNHSENHRSQMIENEQINLHQMTFNWSTSVKSYIISSFFICYVLSQLAGGVATQYFGTKHVFGWSQFATACSSLCIPYAATRHYGFVIGLRCVQGFASGLTWPAMYASIGVWIPLMERSRFMSSFQGFSIGIGLTYVLCGYIINNHGWPYAFYTTGSLGLLWCVMWFALAYNSPQEHPRITNNEREYIETHVSTEIKEDRKRNVPWRSIFASIPAWAIGITTFGRIWIHYIFIVSGPNFMSKMLEFTYEVNGFLSGMAFVGSYLSSVIFCCIADRLLLNNNMSLLNVRRLFTGLSQIVPGVLLLVIGYADNIVLLLVIWFIAVAYITASYAGAMANIVDIAPNYAGPVLAFCQTIHMSASFLSPLMAGYLVTNETDITQWRLLFRVATAIAILTFFFYMFFGSAEVQKWDYSTDTYLESPQSYTDSATASLSSTQQNQPQQLQQQQQQTKDISTKIIP